MGLLPGRGVFPLPRPKHPQAWDLLLHLKLAPLNAVGAEFHGLIQNRCRCSQIRARRWINGCIAYSVARQHNNRKCQNDEEPETPEKGPG